MLVEFEFSGSHMPKLFRTCESWSMITTKSLTTVNKPGRHLAKDLFRILLEFAKPILAT